MLYIILESLRRSGTAYHIGHTEQIAVVGKDNPINYNLTLVGA